MAIQLCIPNNDFLFSGSGILLLVGSYLHADVTILVAYGHDLETEGFLPALLFALSSIGALIGGFTYGIGLTHFSNEQENVSVFFILYTIWFRSFYLRFGCLRCENHLTISNHHAYQATVKLRMFFIIHIFLQCSPANALPAFFLPLDIRRWLQQLRDDCWLAVATESSTLPFWSGLVTMDLECTTALSQRKYQWQPHLVLRLPFNVRTKIQETIAFALAAAITSHFCSNESVVQLVGSGNDREAIDLLIQWTVWNYRNNSKSYFFGRVIKWSC